mmetsp:Transcript_8145/g.16036  ORF Transcript_8145/g.16036 Transcript_8145/m.16036 type:complete len:325 (-) Transcript_8145:4387-5361(-)
MNKLVWAIPLLLVATVAVSSAAPAFVLVAGVTGATKAAWRLQVCGYAMLVLQISDWITNKSACLKMWREGWKTILWCGFTHGLHFVMFAACLNYTSIAHCLIIITACPIAILIHAVIVGNPVHKWEVIGVLTSFGGISLVILDINDDSQATLFGDLLSFAAMIVILIYLKYAQVMLKERQVPIFAFFAPINVVASLTAYAFAVFEGEGAIYFSWTDSLYIFPVIYLGIVPGVTGHLIINYLLKHISMILITVFINLEPLFGSLIGWHLGLQEGPSILLWVGGCICVGGNIIVTVYGSDAKGDKKADSYISDDFDDLRKPLVKQE